MGPFSLLASDHDAGITQNLHVMGKGGLTDFQFVEQNTGAFFAAGEQVENLPAVFITESLKDGDLSAVGIIHEITSVE